MGNAFVFHSGIDLADEARPAECFERTRPALEVMNERRLLPIILDVMTIASAAVGRAPRIRTFRAKAALLPDYDVTCMDVLDERAYALLYAHHVYLTTIQPDGNLPALKLEAMQTRDRFRSDVRSLCDSGLLDSDIAREYTGHPGDRRVAEDLGLLAAIFKKHWDKLAGKTPRRPEDVDRAEALANRMVQLIGRRDGEDPQVVEWMRLRQRAYTLLLQTYDEARSAIVFLRRREGDADAIAPSLYQGRAKRKRARTRGTQPSAPTDLPGSGPSIQ